MRTVWCALLALACGAPLEQADSLCGSVDGSETDKSGGDLSFGTYAPTNARAQSELLEAIQKDAKRWAAATCTDTDLSIIPETWARWKPQADMPPGATGLTSGSFDNARIALALELSAGAVLPVMVHEMGHVLRRDYGHPCEDGSMSFPITRVVSSPVSVITQCDIDHVCAVQDCGCQKPEEP